MEEYYLECRQLTKSFMKQKKEHLVLDGIDFRVKRGEVAVITGRSGAGKSVLLWVLSGLDDPTSGEILVFGQKSTVLHKGAGIIFQDHNLVSSWTISENIEAGMLNLPGDKREKGRAVSAVLSSVGLSGKAGYFPHEISMGEQQRAGIARILAAKPPILFADEPTGNVDPETGEVIIDLLVETARKQHVPLVIATHYHFPLALADSVYCLEQGKLKGCNTR